MPYLVDGYNLAGISKEFSKNGPPAADQVIRFLNRFARAKRTHITVVFDGFPPESSSRQSLERTFDAVKIVFTGNESDADTRIRKMIPGFSNTRGWVVVSSDHAVYDYARVHGVRALRSDEFFKEAQRCMEKHAQATRSSDAKVDSAEVDYWLRVFGEEK
ncbi:MAG: NYN domain-containing protein [Acidobacteriia bacterium]|nr:NYN domain-containing protein [Terriglobia bacterium]